MADLKALNSKLKSIYGLCKEADTNKMVKFKNKYQDKSTKEAFNEVLMGQAMLFSGKTAEEVADFFKQIDNLRDFDAMACDAKAEKLTADSQMFKLLVEADNAVHRLSFGNFDYHGCEKAVDVINAFAKAVGEEFGLSDEKKAENERIIKEYENILYPQLKKNQ